MGRRMPVLAELEGRRRFRSIGVHGERIGASLEEFSAQIRAQQRRAARVRVDVHELLPEGLRGMCREVTLRGGVLTIRAVDTGGRYRLSQWVRGGGRAELMRRVRAGLLRVRVV